MFLGLLRGTPPDYHYVFAADELGHHCAIVNDADPLPPVPRHEDDCDEFGGHPEGSRHESVVSGPIIKNKRLSKYAMSYTHHGRNIAFWKNVGAKSGTTPDIAMAVMKEYGDELENFVKTWKSCQALNGRIRMRLRPTHHKLSHQRVIRTNVTTIPERPAGVLIEVSPHPRLQWAVDPHMCAFWGHGRLDVSVA